MHLLHYRCAQRYARPSWNAYHHVCLLSKSSTNPLSGSANTPNVAYTAITHPIPDPNLGDRTHRTLALAKEYLLPVYARPSFVLDHGKGSWVWDCDGRKYLDFTAGVAVNALGHADDGVSEAGRNLFPAAPQQSDFAFCPILT